MKLNKLNLPTSSFPSLYRRITQYDTGTITLIYNFAFTIFGFNFSMPHDHLFRCFCTLLAKRTTTLLLSSITSISYSIANEGGELVYLSRSNKTFWSDKKQIKMNSLSSINLVISHVPKQPIATSIIGTCNLKNFGAFEN